nr:MAG TPA: hypothetical protein [Caudoviricetes sp.]
MSNWITRLREQCSIYNLGVWGQVRRPRPRDISSPSWPCNRRKRQPLLILQLAKPHNPHNATLRPRSIDVPFPF